MSRLRLLAALLALAGVAACRGSDMNRCEFHANSPWVVFTSALGGAWDISLVRRDGGCRTQLTHDAAFDVNPAYGRGVVAYESDKAPFTSIWLHWPTTGVERRLDLGDLRATSPSFSPDGATLAFGGRRPTDSTGSGIYTVPVTGGTPTLITPEAVPHGNGGPVFAPDGHTVYFVSNRASASPSAYDVWAVPAAGGDPVQVTTSSGILGRPAVSPDGRTLAFTRAAGASTEVVLYDLATRATTPLGIPSASEPAFAPEGDTLAVRVYRDYQPTLVIVNPSSGGVVDLTSGGPDGTPAFAPLLRPGQSPDDVYPPSPGG